MGSAENNRSELEKNCCMFPGTLLMIIPSPNVYIPCQCVGALPPRRGALGGGVSYFKRTRFLVQRNCDHKAVYSVTVRREAYIYLFTSASDVLQTRVDHGSLHLMSPWSRLRKPCGHTQCGCWRDAPSNYSAAVLRSRTCACTCACACACVHVCMCACVHVCMCLAYILASQHQLAHAPSRRLR